MSPSGWLNTGSSAGGNAWRSHQAFRNWSLLEEVHHWGVGEVEQALKVYRFALLLSLHPSLPVALCLSVSFSPLLSLFPVWYIVVNQLPSCTCCLLQSLDTIMDVPSQTINQNKFFRKLLLVMVFYHSNGGKKTTTHPDTHRNEFYSIYFGVWLLWLGTTLSLRLLRDCWSVSL